MRLIIVLSFIFLAYFQGYTQNSLSGKISDQKTHEPLIEAHIYIPDLHKGATTNMDGIFEIKNVPKGDFLVEFGYLGYSTQVIKVTIDGETTQNVELVPSIIEMSEIVVTGTSSSTQRELNPIPTVVINNISSNETSSSNIIDAIAKLPGISQVTTGGAISKPVIRGLGFNRVVVLNNYIRQEGQQWGDEHGIEIDEYSVDRVEIIKGPGSLMYGSDAMAGVIHFLAPKPVDEGKIIGNLMANYQTNDNLIGYSAMNAGNLNGINWVARVSSQLAGNYTNQYDGKVANSGFESLNFNGTMGINKKWGYSQLNFSRFNQTLGLVEGERDESGRFTRPVVINDSSVVQQPLSDSDLKGYHIGIPSQDILHQKVSSNTRIFLKKSLISVNLAFQQNNRKEFSDPFEVKTPELYFLLNTFNYDVKYSFPTLNDWQTSIGINGMQQGSFNKGEEFLIPEYSLLDGGVFGFAQKTFDKLLVSGGLRFDMRNIHSFSLYLDDDDEPVNDQSPDAYLKFPGFNRTFSNVSGSVGGSYKFTDQLTVKLNASRGFRSPNMAELGSNGIHEGTFRYEVGNSKLKPETSFQIDAGMVYNNEHISVEVALFNNSIQNYIFLQKLSSVTGGDSIVDASEAVPTFQFIQGNANLYGGEFSVDVHPHPLDWLHFENTFSFVRGEQLNQPDSSKYLPFMPAPKIQSELRANFNKVGSYLRNLYFRVELDYNFKQSKIQSAYGTETPTPAYTLLHAGIGADIKGKDGGSLFSLSLAGGNLLDVAYQSHLSRLKYASENLATSRRGVFNMGRNISLRLAVPLTLKKKEG